MAKKGNFIASGSTTLEAPDIVRAAFLTEIGLPIYLLTPTPARMTMKIGKTIWTRLLLPGTTAGPSNSHWVKMVQDHDRVTRARFEELGLFIKCIIIIFSDKRLR